MERGESDGWWTTFSDPISSVHPLSEHSEVLDAVTTPAPWIDGLDWDHLDSTWARPRLCVSRAHYEGFLKPEHTVVEYVRAAHLLGAAGAAAARSEVGGSGGWSWGQPFWFLVRQVFELALKIQLAATTQKWPTNHLLGALRDELREASPNDPLLEVPGFDEFVDLIENEDRRSDGGRYHVDATGNPALKSICCLDPAAALWFVRRIAESLDMWDLTIDGERASDRLAEDAPHHPVPKYVRDAFRSLDPNRLAAPVDEPPRT